MAEHDEYAGDVAAYALGALDEAEVERVRRHLDSCVVCRDELASLQSAVDALPLAAPQTRAPRGLDRRIMRAIDQERRSARRVAPPAAARRAWRPVLAGAGALAVAVGVVAALESSSSTPPARTISARVIAVPGTAVLQIQDGHARLVVRHMQPPPLDKIYEVWVKRGQRAPAPTSALFNVTSSGSGSVDVPGDLHGVTEVMVTPEPLGGSSVPTHTPVIDARLA